MKSHQIISQSGKLTRRAFFQHGVLCLAAIRTHSTFATEPTKQPALRIGLVTDLHYGAKPAKGSRFYRDTLPKLEEAVQHFNTESPAFVVELGDLIDKAPSVDQEIEWLQTIEKIFALTKAPRHYVLGNHCVATLTKAEFAANTAASPRTYYSFDEAGFHFVILDSCYTSEGESYQRDNFDWKDANLPNSELQWLQTDLATSNKPTIIFAHQRLDNHGSYSVRNASQVRSVLEDSGKVLAIFQGHSHENDYQEINGIHYCTLVAMIEGAGLENSGYSMLDVMRDGSLRVRGFRQQREYGLKYRA